MNGQERTRKIREAASGTMLCDLQEPRPGQVYLTVAPRDVPAASRWVHDDLDARFLITIGADTRKMDAPLAGSLRARHGPGFRRLARLLARRRPRLRDRPGLPRSRAPGDPDDHRPDPGREMGGERDPGSARREGRRPPRPAAARPARRLAGRNLPAAQGGAVQPAARSRSVDAPEDEGAAGGNDRAADRPVLSRCSRSRPTSASSWRARRSSTATTAASTTTAGSRSSATAPLTYNQVPFLAERICGICGFIHSTCYVEAAEKAIGIRAPRRARVIRTLLLEIERIHSHLLWLGIAGHIIGFDTVLMQSWRIREPVMWLCETITGPPEDLRDEPGRRRAQGRPARDVPGDPRRGRRRSRRSRSPSCARSTGTPRSRRV